MSRYTYSTCKRRRARQHPDFPNEHIIQKLEGDEWIGERTSWGNSYYGYAFDGYKAPTLRGLLDKIAGEK